MTSNVPQTPTNQMMQWIQYDTMQTFLLHRNHFHMSTAGFDFVNWDVVALAMVGFPEMFHLWAGKHMSHFCGISRMQFTCRFWGHSKCPWCQQDNKTMEHVILCDGNGANQEWINRVTNLEVQLIEVDTHPSIHHCMTESLMEHMPMMSFDAHADQVCQSSVAAQDEIGWKNFAEGKISQNWAISNFSIIKNYIQDVQWINGHQA